MAEAMRSQVGALLKGIDRYNPENLTTLERYVDLQAKENTYDLEANLAILKLYQFNPNYYQTSVSAQILLKSLTNLPHTDFALCKCLIAQKSQEDDVIVNIMNLADLLETCQFKKFWHLVDTEPDLTVGIVGFEDSIRKYVCHVIGITYQTISFASLQENLGNVPDYQANTWITKYGWKMEKDKTIYIANQEENIKTKNITEKISFESVAAIMANAR